jgi:hypothetical protein
MRRDDLVALSMIVSAVCACGGVTSNDGARNGRGGASGGSSDGEGGGRERAGSGGIVNVVDAGVGVGDAGDIHDTDVGGLGFPAGFPAPSRSLSSLDRGESRQFCEEDARRSDPCILEGMQAGDEASCNARVASCRAALTPESVGAACTAPADLAGCDVTVEQYFDCIDAWNEVYVCANAGFEIETPAPCEAVSACGLSDQGNQGFMQLGAPPPCDPSSPPRPIDTNDDIYGLDGCAPVPERLIALGNSVARCDETKAGCAPLALANYLRETYSPSLSYENHAENDSDLVDLLQEAKLVKGGNGHLAVWIFAFPSDPTSLQVDLWKKQLGDVFDYFTDTSRFPDGATFLLNTQYSPSDRCSLGGPVFASDPLTPEEELALQTINQALFVDRGVAGADAVTVDQYPDWLGHGSHANMKGCPYCSTDNTPWQWDAVHPNQAGYDHIFAKWRIAVDEMYGGKCPQ